MAKFTTVRFGELDYREEDVIHLEAGLIGLPDLREWLILDMDDDIPMKWFQSLNRADFGFPISEAALFEDQYEVSLGTDALSALENTDLNNVASLIITTVHSGGDRITGNLLAPLMIDVSTRRGVQLTLDDPRYNLRQEINYLKFGLAVQSESGETANLETGSTDALSGSKSSATENNTPEIVGV
ncbi:MAG: flagellar assembly factor FliW [Candidatus Krumholzibacteriia bacterium]|jgi:flagellar assembly factor FliW